MFNFIKRLEKVEKIADDLRLEMRGGLDINELDLWSLLGKPGKILKAVPLPEQIKQLNSRISLLESQLNLKYYPASEEKKEARYETTKRKFEDRIFGFDKDSDKIDSLAYWTTLAGRPTQKIKKTKKK